MTLPLVILAGLSIVGGFVCTPHWIRGDFEKWLEPVCRNAEEARAEMHEPGKHEMSAAGLQEGHGGAKHEGDARHPAGEGKHEEHKGAEPMEFVLMAFSTAVALGAIAFAWIVYKKKDGAPAEKFANEHRELYELVRDKYRVDELYQNTIVALQLETNEACARFDNTVIDGAVNGAGEAGASTSLYTGYFDNEVVDGGVNAVAKAAQAAGRGTRAIQTGNIRTYIAASVIGGLFVIAFFCLWMMWIYQQHGGK